MSRARTTYGQRDSLDFIRGPTEIANFAFLRQSETATVQGSRIITVPPGNTWETGLHWHEQYVESVKVLKGKARITIAGVTRDYGPNDGVVTFPKLVIHGFGRADRGNSSQGAEETVLEEWVEPEDGFKLVFFYNILGALQDCHGKPGVRDLLQLGTTLAYIDEYPVFVPGPFWFKRIVTHSALAVAYLVGRLFGYEPWLREYTPKHLWQVAQRAGIKTRPKVLWI